MTAVAQHREFNIANFDRDRVLRAADQYLRERPITITAARSTRSAGGVHDFFSEGDYWWPDPENPSGPYIQRDGLTNPNNFFEHRRYLMRLSIQVPALAAAWKLTRRRVYAAYAARHLRAWFIDEATKMNPHLLYAQAIQGRVTGRGIGIIDTIHLVEVARAVEVLEPSKVLSTADLDGIRKWFSQYLLWLTTHPYGVAEREAKNNHGTCWVMQVAAFAQLTKNTELIAYCRNRYKTVLVPNQIARDGSFPEELRRTKPYGYSLFNLEAMATVCQLLSTAEENLWVWQVSDGRGIARVIEFMFPFVKDKPSWPKPADVMYHDHWPMRQSSLLFAGKALNRPEYVALWQRLPADSTVEEIMRNFFIRQPVLWVN